MLLQLFQLRERDVRLSNLTADETATAVNELTALAAAASLRAKVPQLLFLSLSLSLSLSLFQFDSLYVCVWLYFCL